MALQLLQGESIEFVRRRHWFRFVLQLLPICFVSLIILVAPFMFGTFFEDIFTGYRTHLFLAAGLLLQLFLLSFFLIIVDYYLDLWVITNKRLVLIELRGLFSRSVSSIDYSKIQDITTDVHGILPTLLDFGNVRVETAGDFHSFVFKDVPDPAGFKDKILVLKEKALNREVPSAEV